MKTDFSFVNRKFYFFPFAVILIFLFSCADDRSEEKQEIIEKERIRDSLHRDSLKIAEEELIIPPLVIKYRLDSLIDANSRDSILGLYSEEQQRIIFALNRIE
ncbi:hypothetical protein LZ575_06625 [Antarcticibacterium sp. 1MA-6-2]|uniref:hypothetical protein n=1 Tax=Antarcticibacterium sp. 1MA-6-2 TaxID=2908210 RepID=UPI001F37DD26|nr:hypothetical protein [Antarcticibacterium sp. 1MA-6-2]UJH92231.1 hypothetical protein LZ575_06625 [Antarcticibacterium sp. 1MA-6-2]